MKKLNNAVLAKGIAALLAISAIAPGAVYAADTKTPENVITAQAAEDAAIKDAGVKKEEIPNIRTHLEKDDGRYVYDVDFYVGNVEYDYEILAEDGKILEKEKEMKKHVAGSGNTDSEKTTAPDQAADAQTDNFICVDKAREIYLEHAGLKADEVTNCTVDLDKHEKTPEYEIEFFFGDMEYEYDIDAVTGEILDSSAEIDD